MQNDSAIKLVINDVTYPQGTVHVTSDKAPALGGFAWSVCVLTDVITQIINNLVCQLMLIAFPWLPTQLLVYLHTVRVHANRRYDPGIQMALCMQSLKLWYLTYILPNRRHIVSQLPTSLLSDV
jgi:hypothetical protein